jgi:hypothetical protein
LGLLVILSASYPAQTLGALVLIHNFVGFFYWICAAKSREERRVALASLLVFAFLTSAILLGLFDFVMMVREKKILSGSLNEFSIGHFIFPYESGVFWNRAVSAFAFGQGVHYFVWLKAIPEQRPLMEEVSRKDVSPSPRKNPEARKWNLRSHKISLLRLAFGGSAALLLYACLSSFAEARLFYLGLAAFHGYFEIIGLGFFEKARA